MLTMNKKSIKELKDELIKRNLPHNGTKRQLLQRILEYDNAQPKSTNISQETASTECSSNSFIDDDALRAREWDMIRREKDIIAKERQFLAQDRLLREKLMLFSKSSVPASEQRVHKIQCSIREIADTIPSFSPSDITSMSAEAWVTRVENLRKVYEWEEKLLLMAAASKLIGPAKFWWDTLQESTISWEQLASGLKLNFPNRYNELEIHQELIKRVRRPDENIESYCFEVNMLGKRINLTEKSITQYILTGLNDREMSANLAASSFKDIPDLVDKIKLCENIRKSSRSKPISSHVMTPMYSKPAINRSFNST
ncbi:uncharacterized protein LOC129941366 [Eupeodes corollae]|uniref:uncharacterized protein LOC129941366 n=1 Tax=Eupeodes corollae TaxID=290404 RepID=UPI00249319D3|nr:uncharacterized protein LOC129941366 [Eupeodes corollae]